MKKLISLIVLVAGMAVFSANAQFTKVPARVTNSFHARFPEARNLEWRDRLYAFQAKFQMNGARCEAKFNRRGEWMETVIYLSDNGLPRTVKNGVRKTKYRNWEVRSSYVLYTPEGTRYHVKVAKSDLKKKGLLFNAQGQLLDKDIEI